MSPAPSETPVPQSFELLANGEIPTLEQAVELISYADVLVGEEREQAIAYTNESANGTNYAETLRDLIETHGPEVQNTVNRVREQFEAVRLDRVMVKPSKYSQSDSWILWDLAKQKYLSDHPDESSPKYKLADPFSKEGTFKVGEIADRHVAWELDRAVRTEEIDVRKLQTGTRINAVLKYGTRNETGDLSSDELAKLGGLLRDWLADTTVAPYRHEHINWDSWYKTNAPELVIVERGLGKRLRDRLKQ